MKVVIVDNASDDGTADLIRDWMSGDAPFPWPEDAPITPSDRLILPIPYREVTIEAAQREPQSDLPRVTLVRSSRNMGFAGGVNAGLRILMQDPELDLFWVLNPDTLVPSQTTSAYANAAAAAPGFGLMGGRTLYYRDPHLIQSDGMRVNAWTGMCGGVHLGRSPETTAAPDPRTLDFVVGANVVASRAFIEDVGLMDESYFLYYEEVDWAHRGRHMPIVYAPDAIVYHHVGTALGSATLSAQPTAFANYFNFRNRMRFMRKFHRSHLPIAYGYSFLKILRLVSKGYVREAWGAACGLNGLAPPREVRAKLSPDAAEIAFGPSP